MPTNQNIPTDISLITYNANTYQLLNELDEKDYLINSKDTDIKWLNSFGAKDHQKFKQIIRQNQFDDFLEKLIVDEHSNKVIQLDNLLFLGINILKTENKKFLSEQMIFVIGKQFIWSIQEKKGDYFQWIRDSLIQNKGIIRKKKVDFLFYLIIESIIDNYKDTFSKIAELNDFQFDNKKLIPTPEFANLIENRKQDILKFNKATRALRDTISKLENLSDSNFKSKYYTELKVQANNLIYDIEFELQELESKVNLIFNIQGHRLNEVMKTLTIFSVLFIPLTFIAGVYGMNFHNMPELSSKYGYFLTLIVMLIIAFFIIIYFKRKDWF